MNAAIECACKTVIVYDSLHSTNLQCPECGRKWYQQPELFSNDGLAAKRLPYLVDECGGPVVDDESALRLIDMLKKANRRADVLEASAPWVFANVKTSPLPSKVAFVFAEGTPKVIEL